MRKELGSFSALGLNNFLFCILFLLSGSHGPQSAFWSTLFFQLVLLVPLLITFSVDTQHRLPEQRVAGWPLTDVQRFCFSALSFFLNPLFLVLTFGFMFWMGSAVALVFLVLGLFIHVLVYCAGGLLAGVKKPMTLPIPRLPWKVGGITRQMWRELSETLDFWTAFVVAVTGTLYRIFGHSPEPEAFPILSLIVAIAVSTVAQRMLSLDEGQALLRYRLLPIAGWKVLFAQDAAFLLTVAVLVSPLNLRAGCTCGLVSLAIGRYPSIRRRVNQRRWRFVGGDVRFGIAQILLGGAAGLGAARTGLGAILVAIAIYVSSVFWGAWLWNRYVNR